jgi:hypothetical protein
MVPRRGNYGRRLADLTIYPPAELCYEPPPHEECEEFPNSYDLALGHRLGSRQIYLRGSSDLVYFSVWQSTKVDGQWVAVARIDCSHGTVHRHQFAADGGNRVTVLATIPNDHSFEFIDHWHPRAARIMEDEWEANYWRWHGDRERRQARNARQRL